jgi:hypothetical protein
MGQHRGSGRGPHVVEHASHLDAADLAQAVALRRDRLVARQLAPYAWSPGRADEIHALGEVHRELAALVDRRLAGPIPDGTPGELALAGAAPERILRALEIEVAQDLKAGGDPRRLFAGIPHLQPVDIEALTTWAAWEATVCTGKVLAAALVAVLHRAVQVSRTRAS